MSSSGTRRNVFEVANRIRKASRTESYGILELPLENRIANVCSRIVNYLSNAHRKVPQVIYRVVQSLRLHIPEIDIDHRRFEMVLSDWDNFIWDD